MKAFSLKSFLTICISIICVYNLSARTKENTDPIKQKKVTTKPAETDLHKNKNTNLYRNPYKINTFCNLIQDGNFNAVKRLIAKGEDIDKISNKLTPLMYAARHNRADIVQLLLDNGANARTQNHKGYTALKWAKLVNATASIEILTNHMKNSRKKKCCHKT